jgi:transcriptional regulator with XRE-family HTH domain
MQGRFALRRPLRRYNLMGSAARRKPVRLAEKLLTIRVVLGLSQNGMIKRIGFVDDLSQAEISMFERGIRVPPLPVILEYAKAANVYVEALIDDSLDLPAKIPLREKHEGVRRKSTPKRP